MLAACFFSDLLMFFPFYGYVILEIRRTTKPA
jgi:hypothetical protein